MNRRPGVRFHEKAIKWSGALRYANRRLTLVHLRPRSWLVSMACLSVVPLQRPIRGNPKCSSGQAFAMPTSSSAILQSAEHSRTRSVEELNGGIQNEQHHLPGRPRGRRTGHPVVSRSGLGARDEHARRIRSGTGRYVSRPAAIKRLNEAKRRT
jgi:hypothetical protein